MSYVGNTPADKFLTLEKQQFSVSATTGYTLSHSVSSPQDIALFINNVRQNPNSSYTVSGTTLTLSSPGTSSGDTMYCVFLGKAIGTVGVPVGGVTVDKISIPDNAKLKIGTGDDLEIYHDGTNSNIANKTGTLKVATETSGVPITLGHTTSLVTVADNVSVTGDIFLGTTSATNSAKMTSLFSRISHIGFVSENNGGNDDTEHFRFKNGNGTIGNIVAGNSSTAYNTSSDYRLKENVDYTFDATTRLKQLKPARFNFITDETNTLVDGFLAHEVSSVVPEAIYGDKDGLEKNIDGTNALDADGNTIPKYQGIDQSKLVPLLVKTIQELEARITELENA